MTHQNLSTTITAGTESISGIWPIEDDAEGRSFIVSGVKVVVSNGLRVTTETRIYLNLPELEQVREGPEGFVFLRGGLDAKDSVRFETGRWASL